MRYLNYSIKYTYEPFVTDTIPVFRFNCTIFRQVTLTHIFIRVHIELGDVVLGWLSFRE